MSSTVVLLFQPPASWMAERRHTPAVPAIMVRKRRPVSAGGSTSSWAMHHVLAGHARRLVCRVYENALTIEVPERGRCEAGKLSLPGGAVLRISPGIE